MSRDYGRYFYEQDGPNEESNITSRTSRHRDKECALCGKKETNHWGRHFLNHHNGTLPIERKQGA